MAGGTQGARPPFSWSWLDPAVGCAALEGADGPVLLADPGADLALGLLGAGPRERPRELWCATGSEAAFALADLKRAAALELPVEGARILLGVEPAGRRVFFYHLMRGALLAPARAWWDGHEALVREGIATCGAFERLLRRAGRLGSAGGALGLGLRALGGAPLRLAGLDPAWASALDPRSRGARSPLTEGLASGAPGALEQAWALFGGPGHAGVRAGGEGLRLRAEPVDALLGERPWGAVVLGARRDGGAGLAEGLRALPSGARVLTWTGGARGPALRGFEPDAALERRLQALDRSLVGGLTVQVRA